MIWLWAGFFGSLLFLCVSFSALYQLHGMAVTTRSFFASELEDVSSTEANSIAITAVVFYLNRIIFVASFLATCGFGYALTVAE